MRHEVLELVLTKSGVKWARSLIERCQVLKAENGDVLAVPMRSRLDSELSVSPKSTTDRSVMYVSGLLTPPIVEGGAGVGSCVLTWNGKSASICSRVWASGSSVKR